MGAGAIANSAASYPMRLAEQGKSTRDTPQPGMLSNTNYLLNCRVSSYDNNNLIIAFHFQSLSIKINGSEASPDSARTINDIFRTGVVNYFKRFT